MTSQPHCHTYIRDALLAPRLASACGDLARFHHHADLPSLEAAIESCHCLVVVDLRDRHSASFLERAVRTWPDSLFIALGDARSEPGIEAEGLAHAIVDPDADHREVRGLLRRAAETLALRVENAELRRAAARPAAPAPERERDAFTSQLWGAVSVSAGGDGTVDGFLAGVVDRLVEGGALSRAGVFAVARDSDSFVLRAACRAVSSVRLAQYERQDPLVRWMRLNAHMAAVDALEHVSDPATRAMLRDAMISWGAEAVVPLHSRDRLLGWMFFGRRATGEPLSGGDCSALVSVAAQAASGLDRALLQEDLSARRTLLDTLLVSLPIGIVSTSGDWRLNYINPAARALLGIESGIGAGRPVSALGSRIADMVHRCLRQGEVRHARYADIAPGRTLDVHARPLMDASVGLGALVMIEDVTAEIAARDKDRESDRARLWADLARGLSQEIRNSLVALSTYTQLLPERGGEEDFLAEFTSAVPREVDRLSGMVDRINSFASLGHGRRASVEVSAVVAGAVDLAKRAADGASAKIIVDVPAGIAPISGDQPALISCLSHGIVNALEACEGLPGAEVKVAARPISVAGQSSGVSFVIRDNGRGMAASAADRAFSPFFTTKGRGMGLGLPIAQRTVAEHGGSIEIQTGPDGTTLRMVLPTEPLQEKRHDDQDVACR